MENKEIKMTIFEAGTQQELEAMMTANCLKEEEFQVTKVYNEPELMEMRKEYTRNAVEISLAIAELNKKKAEIMEKIKEPKKTNDYILAQLQTGCSQVNQQVYLFDYQDEGVMGYYDANGKLVYQRPLMPNERQINIVSVTR